VTRVSRNSKFKIQNSKLRCLHLFNQKSEITGTRARVQKSLSGFTLLELMISITMLVIIIVIISAAMRIGFRSVASGEKKVESLERLRTSLSIINAQIQSGLPITFLDQGATKYYFKGGGKSLQLSTNYSVWGGQRGYVIVTYRVETDQSGKQALYASEHIIGMETSRETKLLEAFNDIHFEYFEKGLTVDEPGKWVQDWTNDAAIPTKIRLHLLSGMKERSMIIPVRARGLPGGSPT
jgi:general secretion pathway protein J